MSDRNVQTRSRRSRRSTAARGSLPARGDVVDAFWRELWGRVEEMIAARQVTMGTVTGSDSGKVKVRLDDEEDARTVGFPRALGVAYDNGDRVPVAFTRGGEPFVLPVMGSGGTDKRVRTEQLDDNAVDGRALKSVNGRGDISHAHLTNDLSDQIRGAATTEQLNNKTSGLASKNDLRDKADKSDLANKADQSEVNRLKDDVAKLKKEIDNLKSKDSKKDKKAQ